MTGKNFSIILTVDLSCCRCHDKMKKILSKNEGRWCIKSVVWDEKKNKITLTGPFCPHELAKKLRCKAGKVIKNIDFPDACTCDCAPPPPPPPPKPDSPKPDPAPPPPKPDPKPVPVIVKPVVPVAFPVWPTCCCCPSYKGHGHCGCRGEPGGGHRPCSCGCGWGCSGGAPRRAHVPPYGWPYYDGCRVEFSCEEEPSWCRPM